MADPSPTPACPDPATLSRFLTGQLSPADDERVQAHLAGCDHCASRLGGMEGSASSDPEVTTEELQAGAHVGRYVVLEKLGQGGMGAVYAAYDPELDRRIALKVLRHDRASGGSTRTWQLRLQREAQAMARVSHPNVLAVHDVGTLGDRVFLAMEYVAGSTLTAWLQAAPRSAEEILRIFIAAGRGLEAAHESGLVHRDFKPDNVLIGARDRPLVTDFGLARFDGAPVEAEPTPAITPPRPSHSTEPLTEAGVVMGTPRYMSPEQHLGVAADARSDQFSFCAALFTALYRRPPFEPAQLAVAAAMQTAEARGRGQLPVAAGWVVELPSEPSLPRAAREALRRGLSLDREARFPSMAALLEQLGHDTRTVRRRALVAALVLLAAGATALAAQQRFAQTAQLCSGGRDRVATRWSPEARARVERSLSSTAVPTRAGSTVALLDSYASRWAEGHDEACRATRVRREQPEAVLALRMVCLDRRLKSLNALVDVLSGADAAVAERAVDAAVALPSLAACSDIDALTSLSPLPEDRAVRARIDALTSELARAQALHDAAQFPAAMTLLTPMLETVTTLQYRPLQAEVLYLSGWVASRTGKPAEAEVQLRRALFEANASRHDEVATRAAIRLAYVVGYELGRREEGHSWASLARSIIERIGGNDALESELLVARANIYASAGQYEQSLPDLERALELLQRSSPDPDHPRRALILTNLGSHLLNLGQPAKAYDALSEALRIVERTRGADHPQAAWAHYNLSSVARQRSDAVTARRHAEEAIRIFSARNGPQHPNVANALDALGNAQLLAGELASARSSFERALAMKGAALGNAHPSLCFSLVGLGEAELDAKDWPAAKGWFERALKLDCAAISRADAQLGNARAHAGLGQQARAHELGTAAARTYREASDRSGAARAEGWLKERAFSAGEPHPAHAVSRGP